MYRNVPEDTVYAVTFREMLSKNLLRVIKTVTVILEKKNAIMVKYSFCDVRKQLKSIRFSNQFGYGCV
jgi:hypothetical protein